MCGGVVKVMAALTITQMSDAHDHTSTDVIHAMVRDNLRVWSNGESNEMLRHVLCANGIVGIVDDVVDGTRILSMMALALLFEPTKQLVMRQLRVFDLTKAPKSVGECDICGTSDDELTELPCKHRFGTTCLIRWLDMHRTCPMCRAVVTR